MDCGREAGRESETERRREGKDRGCASETLTRSAK